MVSQQSSRLWVCHGCEMIGTRVEAKAHEIARGHHIEELSEDVSDGIREQWRVMRAQRAASLLAAAKTGTQEPQGESAS